MTHPYKALFYYTTLKLWQPIQPIQSHKGILWIAPRQTGGDGRSSHRCLRRARSQKVDP